MSVIMFSSEKQEFPPATLPSSSHNKQPDIFSVKLPICNNIKNVFNQV